MSLAEPYVLAPPVRRSGTGLRQYRSELRLLFGRRRTLALLFVLALAPIVLGIALKLSSSGSGGNGDGPPFVDRIAGNGLYLAVVGLVVVLPLLLPLAVGVVSADAVAGEASQGTLRYLLTVPVARGRLLVVKYAASLTFCLAATVCVGLAGLVTGLLLFPVGDITTLSGTSLPVASGLLRILDVALYVAASLSGAAAVGLFISTLTEVPVGAMAAAVAVPVVSQVVDAIPQLSWLHPYLLTHHWLDLGDLLRDPVPTGQLLSGLLVQVGWIAVCSALAWARFVGRDVTT
jgi:ABC-2 type transport system permease protein